MADCCRFLLALSRSLRPAVAAGAVVETGGMALGSGAAAGFAATTDSSAQEEAARRKAAAKARQV